MEKSGKSSSSTQLSNATADMKISLEAAKVEREEWMSLPGLIPCVSRNELKKVSKEKLEAEEKQKFMLDRVSIVVGSENLCNVDLVIARILKLAYEKFAWAI